MLSGSGQGIASRAEAARRSTSAVTAVAIARRSSSSTAVRTAACMSARIDSASATLASSAVMLPSFVAPLALLLERECAFFGVRGPEDGQSDLELDLECLGLRQPFGLLHRPLHRLDGKR